MANTSTGGGGMRRAVLLPAIAAMGLLVGACAQLGSTALQLAAAPQAGESTKAAAADGRSELQKATQYWGEAYAKNPRDAQTALNYARNLKALGEKRQALAVLQQASTVNGNHRGISGEYGRLALEFDQISLAQKLLEQAEDPANPDWRIVSARGTVLAKQGRYREAIPHYERALTLAPDQSSILSNLALAHAMEGNADKAEALLRQAAATGGDEVRVSQNLALVLGLQGKYDEAKLAAARSLPADKAAANVDYVRSIVKLEAKPLSPTASNMRQAKDASAKGAQGAELKGAATDGGTAEGTSGWTTQVATVKPTR
jgi:Flp pilus assembly protein TadD